MKFVSVLLLVLSLFVSAMAMADDCVNILLAQGDDAEIVHVNFIFDGGQASAAGLQNHLQIFQETLVQIPGIPRSPALIVPVSLRGADHFIWPLSAKRSALRALLARLQENKLGDLPVEMAPERYIVNGL